MALERARWMLIDDSADDVSYSGDWFQDTYASPGPYSFVGSATEGTAHGTSATGGFSFSFEGTVVVVRGQSNVIPGSTGSVLSCTIDGVEGESDVVNSGNLLSWKLCGASRLSQARHEVVVNITSGPGTIIWVDEITYFSLSPPNLRQQWSKLYPNTGEYSYTGISWRNPFDDSGNFGRESYANGAKATIPFHGERIELAGYMTSSMPRAAGAATYSVDGSAPVPFEIPAWTPSFRGSGSNESIMRHTFFTTPKVSAGLHTLELVNQGNSSTAPLSLHYFVIHHGDLSATGTVGGPPAATKSSNPSGSPSGLQSGSPTSPQGQKSNIGIIIGAIVGVLVLIGAAVLLFFWIWRRRGRNVANSSLWSIDETVALNQRPTPFPVGTIPYRDAPGSSVSSELNPPHYAESELSFNNTSQHHLAHYPQQTVTHYERMPQQMDPGYSMAAPQQMVAGYSVAAPQQMTHGHPVVAPPPQQSTRYPHITPFVQAVDAPSAPLPRRLPPEKQRLNNSRPMESTSAMPSSSSSHSHGATQSSAPGLRTVPPPLPPLERPSESPASRSSSLHSQTRSTRAVPPRVPPPPLAPPRRVPPRLPPSNADPEPPVYHE